MRRLIPVLVVFMLGVVPAWPQHSPEVDALLETFFAKNMATALKHLPPRLQKALSELPADKQAQIGTLFPMAERLKKEGVTITSSDDSEVLATLEHKGNEKPEKIEILLDKRISDGYEAVLRLRVREKNSTAEEHSPLGLIQIWMRFEDGEWRIHELEAGSAQAMNLDDPGLLEQMAGAAERGETGNEAAAVGTMRVYNTAAVTYASTYPDSGFPASLDVLGEVATGGEPSSEHAGLIDPTRATPPYEVAGYRFTYQPGNSSMPVSAYTIVARPLEYGKTGTRSFFTDESGVIRFTADDREPTRADSPLQ